MPDVEKIITDLLEKYEAYLTHEEYVYVTRCQSMINSLSGVDIQRLTDLYNDCTS